MVLGFHLVQNVCNVCLVSSKREATLLESCIMADTPIDPPANDRFDLSAEWIAAAKLASSNIGLDELLHDLSPEHWQVVLANVEARMRLRGLSAPCGWQGMLAQQVGRLAS